MLQLDDLCTKKQHIASAAFYTDMEFLTSLQDRYSS